MLFSFDLSKLEKEEIKKIFFGFFHDATDLAKKDRDIFEVEYLDKLWGYSDIEENEASHKLLGAEKPNDLDKK